jgi:hypothetical protein
MPTQHQMAFEAQQRIAKQNEVFMQMVRVGMTRAHLEKLIAMRPSLWGRFSNWLESLP